MTALKIALIRSRYTAFGGAERFVARAIDTLRAQGAKITLVTRQWERDEEMDALICDPVYIGSLWRDWGFARCVCSNLKSAHFDLVQSHERISCCDVYRAGDGVHREWLSQRRRVLGMFGRLAISLNPYHRYLLAAEKKLFNSTRLKAVICNSHMVKAEIQRYFNVPEAKLHVIYSGVDTGFFQPDLRALYREQTRLRYQIPQTATLYLLVGSGFERKGVPLLLRAMREFPPDAHLLIVGKDKKIKSFQAQAAASGLTQRIHFAGGQQDVRPYYGAADVFVLPTLYDPFPNVALEAMACGLPIITSSKSGAAELIRNGENGYVCDALDLRQLVTFMRQIASGNLKELGKNARKTVENMRLDKMGVELLALYQSLLLPG